MEEGEKYKYVGHLFGIGARVKQQILLLHAEYLTYNNGSLMCNLDKAASISGLCITPSDLKSRLGEFSEYCPVNLALHEQLIDCSTRKSLKFAAEYR